MVLLASVVFALQVTAVTPLTASTSSQHIETQQRSVAAGALATAAENGTLRPTLLFVNNSTGQFHGVDRTGRYAHGGPPTPFGEALNRTFLDRGIAFNLDVHFVLSNGERRSRRIVYTGAPSDNAVAVTRTVSLYDDDALYDPGPTGPVPTANELAVVDARANDSFYAPDAYPGQLYNVVEVEVIVGRR